MSVNWSNIGNILSGLTTALTGAGVSSAQLPNLLQQIGLLSNPNQNEELGICSQILIFAGQPNMVALLAQKLATEQGIPAAAAALALTLTTPGIDVVTRVTQIESIIKTGG